MPLDIIIAGAGIAGLSAAIGLARHGHNVTVFERRHDKDGEDETLGGLQLQPNAVKILRDWGALDVVDKVTHDSVWTDVRKYDTGDTILLIDMAARGGTRFGPRATFKTALQKFAMQCGAHVQRGWQVVAVDEGGARPTAFFADGSSKTADLIIGADGTSSKVRRSLFPSFQPKVLSQCVFQVAVPLDWMEESPDTKALLKHTPGILVHMSPGRAIISSPSFEYGLFDLQLIDFEYPLSADPDPETITGRTADLSYVRRRLADHEPGVIKVVEKADSVWKWRLREVRGLPSWSSQKGGILMIGDASHGIVPHAGQGASTGVEDGAVLGELLAGASPQEDIRSLVKLYEAIRRPRCDMIRTFATIQGAMWSTKDPGKRQQRDRNLAAYQTQQPSTKPDQRASFSTPEFQIWLDQYDVKEEVMKARSSTARALQARL